MHSRYLGDSSLKVSRIGLGCVTFGREIDRSSALDIMDHAIASGITLFDTAAVYGDGASEKLIGEWLGTRSCRDQIVLATKVSGTLSRQHILTSVEESLRRLDTDCIDLLQMHTWDETTPLEETLSALSLLVDQGKVREIGCSNYSLSHLKDALQLSEDSHLARMISVQPPYNLVQREIEDALIPFCQSENVGVISYSPLAAGFLTGKYRRGGTVPNGTRFDVIPGHQDVYFHEQGYATLERLEAAAQETGQSQVHLALSWVLQQNSVTSVLIGARTPAHVDQALQAANAPIEFTF